MPYEKISLNIDGVLTEIEIRDPCIIRFYKDNPERVRDYFSKHIRMAKGDIESGEGLDKLIYGIDMRAMNEKIMLLENIQRDREILGIMKGKEGN